MSFIIFINFADKRHQRFGVSKYGIVGFQECGGVEIQKYCFKTKLIIFLQLFAVMHASECIHSNVVQSRTGDIGIGQQYY
jgi:hypothetical protein